MPATEQQDQEFIQPELTRRMFQVSAFAIRIQDGRRIRSIIPSVSGTELEIFFGKGGRASKAAIADMPVVVKIVAGEEEGECSICLMEYSAGDKVKEMPCKHRYHSICEKWLGIHGSCPVCGYKMPVDKETERVGQTAQVIELVFRRRLGGESGMDGAPDVSESGRDSDRDSDRPRDRED